MKRLIDANSVLRSIDVNGSAYDGSIEKEMKKCCGDRECDECKRTYWLTEVTDND